MNKVLPFPTIVQTPEQLLRDLADIVKPDSPRLTIHQSVKQMVVVYWVANADGTSIPHIRATGVNWAELIAMLRVAETNALRDWQQG